MAAQWGKIDQIGYVVAELDAGIRHWIDMAGVGPWTVFRDVRLEGRYRGEAVDVVIHVALGYQGDVQIELIEPVNAAPSPYRGADGAPLCGIHHIAWVVDDLDGAVAAATGRGLNVAFEARNPVSSVAYMEGAGQPGILFELIENPAMRDMIAAGIAASREWNGQEAITELAVPQG